MGPREQRFSLGWVVISYFIVAGGFVLAGAVTALFKISSSSEALGYAFLFLGAAVGGFFAGRASPGTTMVEPGFGALMLFVSLFALMATVPAIREVMTSASDAGYLRAAVAGLAVGAGGFAGGLLGEKTSNSPSQSAIRWLGLSALIALGAMFVVSMVIFMISWRNATQAEAAGPDSNAAIGFAILGLGALLGGAITQAAAPKRMLVVSGSGMAIVLVGLVALMSSVSPARADSVLGMLVIAPLSIGVGVLGALATWAFKRRGYRHEDVSVAFE